MENKNIARKLVAVMRECSHVAKNGINDYHKYKYATAEDVLQKVNVALGKHNIASVVVPTIESVCEVLNRNDKKERLATVSVQIRLIDSDSGEMVDLYGIGSGQDAGDKAIMKAQTAAIKYAYMLSLCIATGDDPEADSDTDKDSETVEPAKKFERKNDKYCSACGVEIKDEKVRQYSIKWFKKPLCRECQKTANKVA